MESLNNIISDYDIELQRLSDGQDTTRGINKNNNTKIILRKDLREKFINQTYTSLEYLDAMALTIGNENLNPSPLIVPINDILDTTNNEDVIQDQCHVRYV